MKYFHSSWDEKRLNLSYHGKPLAPPVTSVVYGSRPNYSSQQKQSQHRLTLSRDDAVFGQPRQQKSTGRGGGQGRGRPLLTSYPRPQHQQPKSNNFSNIGYQQQQVQLVEKMLNQISLNKSYNNSTLVGPSRGVGRGSQTFYPVAKKNQHHQQRTFSNSGHAYQSQRHQLAQNNDNQRFNKNNDGKLFSTVTSTNFSPPAVAYYNRGSRAPLPFSSNFGGKEGNGSKSAKQEEEEEYCNRCEYVYTGEKLVPRVQCTHKLLPPSVLTNPKQHPPPPPANASQQHVWRKNSNHTFGQLPFENPLAQFPLLSPKVAPTSDVSNSTKSALAEPEKEQATRPRQCINYPKNKDHMAKFVEASIVFDHNVIDIIGFDGEILQKIPSSGPPQLPVIVEQQTESQQVHVSNQSMFLENDVSVSSVAKVLLMPQKLDDGQQELINSILAKKAHQESSNSNNVNLTELSVSSNKNGQKSFSSSFQTPSLQMASKQHKSTSKTVSLKSFSSVDETVFLASSEAHCYPVDVSSPKTPVNLQQNTAKKVTGLIANFVTLEVDQMEEEDEWHSKEIDEAPEEDVEEEKEEENLFNLSNSDCEKLGFQNFDGKNIGLYKNIGYINRNREQFVQPTLALLNLMVSLPNQSTSPLSDKSVQEVVESSVSPDLSQFYDHVSPTSYSKETIYSVIESLSTAENQNCAQDDDHNVNPNSSKKMKKKQSAKMKRLSKFHRKMLLEGTSTLAAKKEDSLTSNSFSSKLNSPAFNSNNNSTSKHLKETSSCSSSQQQHEKTLKDDHLSSSEETESSTNSSQENPFFEDELTESSDTDEQEETSYPDSFYITVVVFNADN